MNEHPTREIREETGLELTALVMVAEQGDHDSELEELREMGIAGETGTSTDAPRPARRGVHGRNGAREFLDMLANCPRDQLPEHLLALKDKVDAHNAAQSPDEDDPRSVNQRQLAEDRAALVARQNAIADAQNISGCRAPTRRLKIIRHKIGSDIKKKKMNFSTN